MKSIVISFIVFLLLFICLLLAGFFGYNGTWVITFFGCSTVIAMFVCAYYLSLKQ